MEFVTINFNSGTMEIPQSEVTLITAIIKILTDLAKNWDTKLNLRKFGRKGFNPALPMRFHFTVFDTV